MKTTVTLVGLYIAVAFAASPAFASYDEEDELIATEILPAWKRIEAANRRLTVAAESSFTWFAGRQFDPALSADFRYSTDKGCVFNDVIGEDLESVLNQPRGQRRRIRLYTPDGSLLTYYGSAGKTLVANDAPSDARHLNIPMTPHEVVWSFLGQYRSNLLKSRPTRIREVRGVPPQRIVTLEAGAAGSDILLVFECEEELGWFARTASKLTRDGESYIETYKCTVESVHNGRMGVFPKSAALWSTRKLPGVPATMYLKGRYIFEEPRYHNVRVPSAEEFGAFVNDAIQGDASANKVEDRAARMLNTLLHEAQQGGVLATPATELASTRPLGRRVLAMVCVSFCLGSEFKWNLEAPFCLRIPDAVSSSS